MDVIYFLKERTRFIRQFYETAAQPFDEILRKIEAGEEPYAPGYSEYEEPPFLTEWQEAYTSLRILGQACVSLLSEALKLYFQTWETELRVTWAKEERDRYFKNGFVRGYPRCYSEVLGIIWSDCGVNFDLIEQITLARNAAQHPDHISRIEARHDVKSWARFPNPFFVSETEPQVLSPDHPFAEWFAPTIHVSREKLTQAIAEVEKLADWLEGRFFEAKHRPRHSQQRT